MSFCLEIWLLYAATCSAAGWLFSFFRILNAPAYLVLHIFFFISISLFYRSQFKHLFRSRTLHKISARFFPARRSHEHTLSLRRLLPASFFFLALLSLLAGAIYSPNNFDALTYRLHASFTGSKTTGGVGFTPSTFASITAPPALNGSSRPNSLYSTPIAFFFSLTTSPFFAPRTPVLPSSRMPSASPYRLALDVAFPHGLRIPLTIIQYLQRRLCHRLRPLSHHPRSPL